MASKHTTIKRTLRGRLHTRSGDIARTLKYQAVDVDFDALRRELCTPVHQQRTFGGAR